MPDQSSECCPYDANIFSVLIRDAVITEFKLQLC